MAVFTSIGAFLTPIIGTFWAGVSVAGLQIASGVIASTLFQSTNGQPQPARFAVQGQVTTGEDVPRSIGLGESCTAGSKVYQNEWGPGGTYSTRVLALYDYPVQGLRRLFVDGVGCTVLTGEPDANMGWPVAEYRKQGRDHLWIKFYDGRQTAADPFLVNTVSSAERPYSASRIGRGVTYAIITSRAPERRDDEEGPPFQGFPAYKVETYGARLYDVSRDSTAGGIGPQRWHDPATWGGDGDFLVPVQIYNLLRGIRYNGQWLYGLQRTTAASLPATSWIAAINKARAPGGNRPTLRAGGELQVGAPIHMAVEALLTAGAGRLSGVGGIFKVAIGDPDNPVASFSDPDIYSTDEQSFSPFFTLADTINGIDGKWPNPAEGWAVKDTKHRRPDLEAQDGERSLAPVSFDLVPYPEQVQWLMQSGLAEALRARRHTFALGPEFRVLEPNDVVRYTSVRNGYVDKRFRVDGMAYRPNGDVLVDLTEIDPADYGWIPATDYRPPVDGPLTIAPPRPMLMTGFEAHPWSEDGRPQILVKYPASQPDVRAVRVLVKRLDGTTAYDSDAHPYSPPWQSVLVGSFKANTDYDVLGLLVRKGNGLSYWSEPIRVRTPDIRVSIQDVDASFRETVGLLTSDGPTSIEQRILDVQAKLQKLGGVVSASSAHSEVQRIEARAEADANRAAVLVELLAYADELSALAQLTQEIRVDLNGVSASGLFSMQAIGAPAGVSVRLAILARKEVSGLLVETGFVVDIFPDNSTRIGVKTDSFWLLDTFGGALRSPFRTEGGFVYLDNAVIKAASLNLARVGEVGSIIADLIAARGLSRMTGVEDRAKVNQQYIIGATFSPPQGAERIKIMATAEFECISGGFKTIELLRDGVQVTRLSFNNGTTSLGNLYVQHSLHFMMDDPGVHHWVFQFDSANTSPHEYKRIEATWHMR